jgi:hypothetical protein
MQVVEGDLVRAQRAQALLDLGSEDLRPALAGPVATTTVSSRPSSASPMARSLSPPL